MSEAQADGNAGSKATHHPFQPRSRPYFPTSPARPFWPPRLRSCSRLAWMASPASKVRRCIRQPTADWPRSSGMQSPAGSKADWCIGRRHRHRWSGSPPPYQGVSLRCKKSIAVRRPGKTHARLKKLGTTTSGLKGLYGCHSPQETDSTSMNALTEKRKAIAQAYDLPIARISRLQADHGLSLEDFKNPDRVFSSLLGPRRRHSPLRMALASPAKRDAIRAKLNPTV